MKRPKTRFSAKNKRGLLSGWLLATSYGVVGRAIRANFTSSWSSINHHHATFTGPAFSCMKLFTHLLHQWREWVIWPLGHIGNFAMSSLEQTPARADAIKARHGTYTGTHSTRHLYGSIQRAWDHFWQNSALSQHLKVDISPTVWDSHFWNHKLEFIWKSKLEPSGWNIRNLNLSNFQISFLNFEISRKLNFISITFRVHFNGND